MNRLELQEALRPVRRDLVLAAERVVKEAAPREPREREGEGQRRREADRERGMPDHTQFSHLLAICGQATCAEEIENYLRYQAGRGVWKKPFVDKVIDGIREVLGKLRDDDERVEAWRLYALYLTRARRYHGGGGGNRQGQG